MLQSSLDVTLEDIAVPLESYVIEMFSTSLKKGRTINKVLLLFNVIL
jgi:hypothetical protein